MVMRNTVMQTADRITLRPGQNRIRIYAGDNQIADTAQAIELHETGYPVRYYIPRHDVAMEYLVQSETVTHCPYKGNATYYSVESNGKTISDAAWSYEQPFADMSLIENLLAFDPDRVTIRNQ